MSSRWTTQLSLTLHGWAPTLVKGNPADLVQHERTSSKETWPSHSLPGWTVREAAVASLKEIKDIYSHNFQSQAASVDDA